MIKSGVARPQQPSVRGAPVELRGLSKRFGSVAAVDDLTLAIEAGEFVTLLGPSGSGKTTTLNMIAGFMEPTTGEIVIGGRNVTNVPPYRRDIGMVFQNYALFPHLTVWANVAFPLKMRKVRLPNIRERVDWVLDLVRLTVLQDRFPRMLSGGQQQRVALARALVFNPELLLMDEPLAALDRALREELQDELKNIHERLRPTVLYVTHDQEEALRLSNRIAVMREGRVEQVGRPEDVYARPSSAYVAGFLGKSNFIPGRVAEYRDGTVMVISPDSSVLRVPSHQSYGRGDTITVAVRPENLRFVSDATESDQWPNLAKGEILSFTFLGAQGRWRIRVWGIEAILIRPLEAASEFPRVGEQTHVAWTSEAAGVVYASMNGVDGP